MIFYAIFITFILIALGVYKKKSQNAESELDIAKIRLFPIIIFSAIVYVITIALMTR